MPLSLILSFNDKSTACFDFTNLELDPKPENQSCLLVHLSYVNDLNALNKNSTTKINKPKRIVVLLADG